MATNQEIVDKIKQIKELLDRKILEQEKLETYHRERNKELEIEIESLNNSLTGLEAYLKKQAG